jgi:hypothetical protein
LAQNVFKSKDCLVFKPPYILFILSFYCSLLYEFFNYFEATNKSSLVNFSMSIPEIFSTKSGISAKKKLNNFLYSFEFQALLRTSCLC